MKNPFARAFLTLILFLIAPGANPWSLLAPFAGPSPLAMQTQPPPAGGQAPAPNQFRLEDGTPIRIRLSRTISSADAQVDERVDFEVLEEVKVGDMLVIPKGSVAWGTVTAAQPKRRMGRGGKLDVNIDSVRLADGEKAALRGTKDVKGGGHTGAMTAGIVATGLIVWPAAPFFLFMHGKDITIPKGTEIAAYINGDMNLDPAKFSAAPGAPPAAAATPNPAQPSAPEATPQPAPVATTAPAPAEPGAEQPPPQPAPVPTTPTTPAQPGAPEATPQPAPAVPSEDLATVAVKSTPDGADITIDGKFVGSTPSTVRLPPGDHTVVLEKSGYKTWQRTMAVSPGATITVGPTLEKNAE